VLAHARMTIRSFYFLLPSLFLLACSSSSSPANDSSGDAGPAEAGSDDAASSLLAPPPAGQGVQFTMQTTIAASTEDERCQFVQTTEDLWVNHEEIRYTPGSHHFILWNTPYTSIPTVNSSGATVDTTQVFDCVGGPAAAWSTTQIVGGAQSADAPPALSDLPSNVALHIPAGSVLVMDLHVLNASTAALAPFVAINLDTIPQSQVSEEAGMYFFYDPFIVVPPNAAAQARMSCPVTSNVTLTTAQTHMHKWGLGGSATLEDATGATLQALYSSSVWTDPPVTQWSPGMALQAGQQIDYECNYQNDGTTTVIQGLSAATNEMCVFFGAYYPRDTKFETCSTTGSWKDSSNAATYIGTGTATCQASMQCLTSAKTQEAVYTCVVDSCPKSAQALTATLDCFQANGSASQTACSTQLAQCNASSCN
jgi:hypothetical protein